MIGPMWVPCLLWGYVVVLVVSLALSLVPGARCSGG